MFFLMFSCYYLSMTSYEDIFFLKLYQQQRASLGASVGLLPCDLDIIYPLQTPPGGSLVQWAVICLYKGTRNKLSSTTDMCITSAFQVTSGFICQSECITLWISLICHIFFKEDLSILHNCTPPLLLSVIFGED